LLHVNNVLSYLIFSLIHIYITYTKWTKFSLILRKGFLIQAAILVIYITICTSEEHKVPHWYLNLTSHIYFMLKIWSSTIFLSSDYYFPFQKSNTKKCTAKSNNKERPKFKVELTSILLSIINIFPPLKCEVSHEVIDL